MNIRCLPAATVAAVTFAAWLHCAAPAIGQEAATPQAAPIVAPAVGQPRLSTGGEEALRFSRAKISDDVAVAFIQNADRRYTLTASEIIYLRKEGVSDRVLTALINHQPGASASAPPDFAQPATNVAGESSSTSTVYVATSAPVYYPLYDPWPYWYDPWPYYYPYFSLGFSWGWGGCYYGYYGCHDHHGHDGHNGHLHATYPGGNQTANANRTAIARAGQPNTVASGGSRRGIEANSPVASGGNSRTIAGSSSGQVGSQTASAASVSRAGTAVSAGRVSSSGGTMNPGVSRGGGSPGITSAPRMSAGGGFQGGSFRGGGGGGFQGGGGGFHGGGGGGGGGRR